MKIQRWPWTFYEVAVRVFFCEYIFSFCWIYFIFPTRKIDKKNTRRIHSEFVSRGNTTGYLYSVIALGVLRIYTQSFALIIWRFTLHSEYVFQVHSEKNRGSKNMHAEWKRKLVFMPEPYCRFVCKKKWIIQVTEWCSGSIDGCLYLLIHCCLETLKMVHRETVQTQIRCLDCAVSDQGLHCLPTAIFVKNQINLKKWHLIPLK